jgi:hypothetical protein
MSHLVFRKTIALIYDGNYSAMKQILKQFKAHLTDEFVTFVKTHTDSMPELQRLLERPLVVVERTVMKSKYKYCLLFDGRFCRPDLNVTSGVLCCLLFDQQGKLIKRSKRICDLPMIWKCTPHRRQQPLWQLLNLALPENDPTSYEETLEFLSRHNLFETTIITLIVKQNPHPMVITWHEPLKCKYEYRLHAFTTRAYKLAFCKQNEIVKNIEHTDKDREKANDPHTQTGDIFSRNKSSSVSVKLNGLNQGLHLGTLLLNEFQFASFELGNCVCSLWIECDEKNNANKITYVDFAYQYCIDVDREDPYASWYSLFSVIFQRRQVLSDMKAQVLQCVMDRLEPMTISHISSPWKRCSASLKKCIGQMLLLVYSKDDSSIHCIKPHFTRYMQECGTKGFRGVYVKSNLKNDITSLSVASLRILNIGQYFGGENILNDYNNPAICIDKLKLGFHLAHSILLIWKQLAHEFLTLFNIDIQSIGFVTLSTLAFKSIWTKYARDSGPMHHGLEKMKPEVESLLREKCQGGFSWSCQDSLESGQPLYKEKNGSAVATSIVEYDINSSYGYAASHMTTPTGFCYSFVDDGNDSLQRTDKFARHKSFEFKSVYYTLWQISISEEIKYVYSNYHMLGFLKIGPYPIDLVIITSSHIRLYQFDGRFTHGCRQGCPDLKKYMGFKSRHSVETETARRDAFILEWSTSVNLAANRSDYITYSVITDCHTEKYTTAELKHSYENNPVLKQFISGYHASKVISKDALYNCSKTTTFIACVKGFVPGDGTAMPFFMKGRHWQRARDTGRNNELLVTKDYLEYLVTNYNFRITHVSLAVFYKTCQVFSNIFSQLLDERLKSDSPVRRQLIKNVINFSAGFFGYNAKKHHGRITSHRITGKLSRTFDITRTEVRPIYDAHTSLFVTKMTSSLKSQQAFMYKNSIAPLALFISIIECGKLRLAELFDFLDRCTIEGSVRHLYSNVDNGIFAISGDSLDDCVRPEMLNEYLQTKKCMFDELKPGCFQNTWTFGNVDCWKFASAHTRNYAIVTNDSTKQIHKMSSIKNISSLESYEFACKLLDRQQVEITQTRRTNKLLNMDIKDRTLKYKLNLD